MKNLAVFFPGIGYTNEKPLLYYTKKILLQKGFEIITLNYSGFPEKILGDNKKIKLCEEIAFEQSEICLASDDFSVFDNILFVSKSIGTVAAARFADEKKLKVNHIFFTPLEDSFKYAQKNVLALHGTEDPWFENEKFKKICLEQKVRYEIFEGANHSLECPDIYKSIEILKAALKKVESFVDEIMNTAD